jgi:hypothetical protein
MGRVVASVEVSKCKSLLVQLVPEKIVCSVEKAYGVAIFTVHDGADEVNAIVEGDV